MNELGSLFWLYFEMLASQKRSRVLDVYCSHNPLYMFLYERKGNTFIISLPSLISRRTSLIAFIEGG